jgi:hypothetical protein
MLTSFFSDGGRVDDKPFVDFNKVSGIPPMPEMPRLDRPAPPPFMSDVFVPHFKHGGNVGYMYGDTQYASNLNPDRAGRMGRVVNIGHSARRASEAVSMQHLMTPTTTLQ